MATGRCSSEGAVAGRGGRSARLWGTCEAGETNVFAAIVTPSYQGKHHGRIAFCGRGISFVWGAVVVYMIVMFAIGILIVGV